MSQRTVSGALLKDIMCTLGSKEVSPNRTLYGTSLCPAVRRHVGKTVEAKSSWKATVP